ncbi:hypothetical protein OAA99_01245 [Omnitrophica bacterium]|nr:hypothetical protein [Candidatus Omnitrophota bacterium]
MSGKLFLQIVALIIIFALVSCATKCLKRSYCPMFGGKSGMCAKCAVKTGK